MYYCMHAAVIKDFKAFKPIQINQQTCVNLDKRKDDPFILTVLEITVAIFQPISVFG